MNIFKHRLRLVVALTFSTLVWQGVQAEESTRPIRFRKTQLDTVFRSGGATVGDFNGNDPGADDPALLCWYELQHEDGQPVWTRHVIDDDSGVGMHFEVVDINGNGLLDIATANKKGVFYFEQIPAEE